MAATVDIVFRCELGSSTSIPHITTVPKGTTIKQLGQKLAQFVRMELDELLESYEFSDDEPTITRIGEIKTFVRFRKTKEHAHPMDEYVLNQNDSIFFRAAH